MTCAHCDIYPAGALTAPSEDLDLESRLRGHAVLRVIPPPADWISYGLDETFYQCEQCGQHWHYARPDGPYRGVWENFDNA